jgi:hypothetical protein
MHPPCFRTTIALIACTITTTAAAQSALKKYPEPRVRFDGAVQVGTVDARTAVQADMRTWILAPGLKAERLALPDDAIVIIELHAGKLETLIGEKREQRKPGSIWLVQPGESIAFTTEDDSVTLTTLALRPR